MVSFYLSFHLMYFHIIEYQYQMEMAKLGCSSIDLQFPLFSSSSHVELLYWMLIFLMANHIYWVVASYVKYFIFLPPNLY